VLLRAGDVKDGPATAALGDLMEVPSSSGFRVPLCVDFNGLIQVKWAFSPDSHRGQRLWGARREKDRLVDTKHIYRLFKPGAHGRRAYYNGQN
jgi:hypothetical protein